MRAAFHLQVGPAAMRIDLHSGASMTDAELETAIERHLEQQAGRDVEVVWRGVEPTQVGLEFFRKSIALERKYRAPNTRITNRIETDGSLIDEEWCQFLRQNGFLVGLRLDGPRELYDGTEPGPHAPAAFDRAMRALRLLHGSDVDSNVVTSVHTGNERHGRAVYRFLRDEARVSFMEFRPVVERAESCFDGRPGVTNRTVGAERFGRFLIEVFDEWVRADVGRVFVQAFDVALSAWAGEPSPWCVFSSACSERPGRNADSEACPSTPLVDSKRLFGGGGTRDALPRYCRECDVRFACRGGCPGDRFIEAPDGEAGLNYLCAGYKAFFEHVSGPMRVMAGLVKSGRAPSEIMARYQFRLPLVGGIGPARP